MIVVIIDCVSDEELRFTTGEGKARAYQWLLENDHEGSHVYVEEHIRVEEGSTRGKIVFEYEREAAYKFLGE